MCRSIWMINFYYEILWADFIIESEFHQEKLHILLITTCPVILNYSALMWLPKGIQDFTSKQFFFFSKRAASRAIKS